MTEEETVSYRAPGPSPAEANLRSAQNSAEASEHQVPPKITFLWGGNDDLDRFRGLDPDLDWREFFCGERIWTLQTYLRLVRAGYTAELSSRIPSEGLVVYHSNHSSGIKGRHSLLGGAWLIVIRGDKTRPLRGDYQVVQNGRRSRRQRSFAVPSWPQPGLLPRDPERGDRVRRIAYKGYDCNLDPAFRSGEWRQYLTSLGIEWVEDSVPCKGPLSDNQAIDWCDYRDVDVILAVRPQPLREHRYKPAVKLSNAWAAHVPTILSSEYAFREVRRSELDFLPADSLEEAKAAVRRLVEQPDLYRAMVSNCERREHEFDAESVLDRWATLLYGELGPKVAGNGRHWGAALTHSLPLLL